MSNVHTLDVILILIDRNILSLPFLHAFLPLKLATSLFFLFSEFSIALLGLLSSLVTLGNMSLQVLLRKDKGRNCFIIEIIVQEEDEIPGLEVYLLKKLIFLHRSKTQ